jgi:cobalt-precorrin-7 (C5)-methyltransferase
MKIIGVGAGPGMLTLEAIKAIAEARQIYGSERALELAREHITPGCDVKVIEDYKSLRQLPVESVVLSTGDPMLSGLGYLEGQVIPGISSMQVACARLKLSQLQVVPITVHGRQMDPELAASELRRGRCVFLLIDESSDIKGLCRFLQDSGLPRDVAVLTDLGYPEERVVFGSTAMPPEATGLSCVVIGELDHGLQTLQGR